MCALLAALFLLTLGGCGEEAPIAPTPTPTPVPEPSYEAIGAVTVTAAQLRDGSGAGTCRICSALLP